MSFGSSVRRVWINMVKLPNPFSKKWMLLGLGFVVFVVGMGLVLRPREPVYQGKALSYWLEQLRTANRPQAELAFQNFGTDAIPLLWRKLRREFSVSQRCYRAVWDRVPTVVQMCLSPPSNPDDSFDCILKALQALGPSSLPAMTEWLYHRSKWDRLTAILVIRDIDPAIWPNRQKITEGLVQAVRQKEPDTDIGAAACALGRVGPDARDAIPALTALLGAPISYDRGEAAVALWQIERRTNLLPVLKRELNTVPFAPTRSRITAALAEIEAVAKAASPVETEKSIKSPAPP
jgi:hypothetical protein